MSDLQIKRADEIAKYVKAYTFPDYKMGGPRMQWVTHALTHLPLRGDFLDVGTGRGELLHIAEKLGYGPAIYGTEMVPDLIDGVNVLAAYVHALPFPDKRFSVSCCIDVFEHLLPGDDELATKELVRVSRDAVLISANNRHSKYSRKSKTELHINRRPYDEWEALLKEWSGGEVSRYADWPRCTSAMWLIKLR